MGFNGFRSVSEFEAECARLGYPTKRIPFHHGDGDCQGWFVLLVESPPQYKRPEGCASWHLFPEDESAELLNGIRWNVPKLLNGVDISFEGTLAAHGFFPDNPEREKELRAWLLSPDFRRWIDEPERMEPKAYGVCRKRKAPSRVWLATWCVPVERKWKLQAEGIVFPEFARTGYVPGKPHSFENWRYYGEDEQEKLAPESDNGNRTEPEQSAESEIYVSLKALIADCSDAPLCGLYLGTAEASFQKGLITERELSDLRRTAL